MAHKVAVNVDHTSLPDGRTYMAGQNVVLTDEDFSQISPTSFTVGSPTPLTDLGVIGTSGDAVTTQAAVVAAPAALTSAAPAALTSSAPSAVTSTQNATTAAATQTSSYVQADAQTVATLANALKTSYNAAQVDIAALRATLLAVQADLVTSRTERTALQADVAALRTTVANTLAALKATGGPMAAA